METKDFNAFGVIISESKTPHKTKLTAKAFNNYFNH